MSRRSRKSSSPGAPPAVAKIDIVSNIPYISTYKFWGHPLSSNNFQVFFIALSANALWDWTRAYGSEKKAGPKNTSVLPPREQGHGSRPGLTVVHGSPYPAYKEGSIGKFALDRDAPLVPGAGVLRVQAL